MFYDDFFYVFLIKLSHWPLLVKVNTDATGGYELMMPSGLLRSSMMQSRIGLTNFLGLIIRLNLYILILKFAFYCRVGKVIFLLINTLFVCA